MIIACAWCARENKPTFLREVEPFADTRVSHGMCARHEEEWRVKVERLREERKGAPA